MRLVDELRALVRSFVDGDLRFARLYPAAVAAVHADGTLDVIPDDPTMRGQGHRVEQTHGTAGWVGDPEVGDRVLLGFDGADPSKPYVIGARKRTTTKAAFNEGDKAIARVGDTVSLGSLVVTQLLLPPASVVITWYPPGTAGDAAAAAAVAAALGTGTMTAVIVPLGPGVIATGCPTLFA